MIESVFYKRGSYISEIKVHGHAGQNEKGKDIVCSAVSTAILVTTNLLQRMGYINDDTVEIIEIDSGKFHLVNHDIRVGGTVQNILENLEYTLADLERQYSKYIKHIDFYYNLNSGLDNRYPQLKKKWKL